MRAIVVSDVNVATAGSTIVKVTLETQPGVWWPRTLVVHHLEPLSLRKNEEITVKYASPGNPSQGYVISK
jgi:hypothetical protein